MDTLSLFIALILGTIKIKKTNIEWTGKNYCAMGQIMDKLLEE